MVVVVVFRVECNVHPTAVGFRESRVAEVAIANYKCQVLVRSRDNANIQPLAPCRTVYSVHPGTRHEHALELQQGDTAGRDAKAADIILLISVQSKRWCSMMIG